MYRRYSFHRSKLGVPPQRGGFRMGNVGESINSPDFPGQNVLYGRLGGWAETLQTAAQTAVPAFLQYKVFSENLKRERKGLAPLNPEQFAPTLRVGVDAGTRETVQKAATVAGIGIGTLALIGIGAFLLLRRR